MLDLPISYQLAISLVAVIVLLQLRFAVRNSRPVFMILSLVFLVYLVIPGFTIDIYREDYKFLFWIDDPYFVEAAFYVIVGLLALSWGYSKGPVCRIESADLAGAEEALPYEAALLLSLVGLAVTGGILLLYGSVGEAWARHFITIPFAVAIPAFANLSLTYPIFACHAYCTSGVRRPSYLLATLLLGAYMMIALVSGVSTGHVVNLAPFGFIWFTRRKMTLRTAGVILIAGLSLVTTLRFSRVLGAELQSGGTFADAIEQFFHPEKSPLSTFHSFGEFFMFAKTIEIIEDSGLQYGRTYAFVVLDLIPGVIFPEKTEIIDHWSAGRFVPNYSRSGRGQLWPQGFYGEGYMNFGVLGLLAICFFFGWFERWTEGLLRDNGTTLTIPRWYMGCMFASALIVGVRQDVNTIFNSSVLQLIAFVITRELVSLWIPRPDWKRHLDPRIPAQREAMTDYLRSRSSGY